MDAEIGPFAAFFKGWGSFLVGYPASCAGIASILGVYFAQLAGLGDGAVKPVALAAVTLAWILNLHGTRFSAVIQFSGLKNESMLPFTFQDQYRIKAGPLSSS